jgi:hypothetical protein
MRKLEGLLGPALGRDEVIRLALAQRALRDWATIVGPALANRSRPERYDRGTVWVAVEGSAWAQELRLAKPRILAKLREAGGNPDLFEDLRFGVRSIEAEPAMEPFSPKTVREKKQDPRSIREIAEDRLSKWDQVEPTA